jgi:hypothetical protein
VPHSENERNRQGALKKRAGNLPTQKRACAASWILTKMAEWRGGTQPSGTGLMQRLQSKSYPKHSRKK